MARGGERRASALLGALALFGLGALSGAGVWTLRAERRVQARAPEAILADFDRLAGKGSGFQPVTDEEALAGGLGAQCELAWELYRAAPRHARTPELLRTRWLNRINFFHERQEVHAEAASVLERAAPGPLRSVSALARANAALDCDAIATEQARAEIEEALRIAPEEAEWGAALLSWFARRRTADPRVQTELLARAAASLEPDQRQFDARWTTLVERVGESIELELPDVASGARWSLAAARGRSVLLHVSDLDRWDVQQSGRDEQLDELRRMQPHLAERGVQIVSVNEWCAPDGLEAVRRRAHAAGVDWPVLAEPGELEESWGWRFGLREIPVYLFVDAQGRLAAVCARPAPILEHVVATSGR